MKILLVDDEKLALSRLCRIVGEEAPDAEIKSFNLPSEALNAVKNDGFVPDVAFVDVEMPGMSGVELARELKTVNPNINIIFATGYAQYMKAALDMFASGFIMKPVENEEVRKQLKNLRFRQKTKKSLFIRVFGNFDLLKNGIPVRFSLQKSKEMLAYLVHRGGAGVTKKELCAALFEDAEYSAKVQDYFVKIVRSLKKTLSDIGDEELLIQGHNNYSVNTEMYDSDFESGEYRGEYMAQYSWAEGFYSPEA